MYDLASDPTEHTNLAAQHPDVLQRLRARLKQLNTANYKPDRGEGDAAACVIAEGRYQGFYGPWVGV